MENENRYDWDDLEVGRFDLNHSEKFFARKHTKHEKFDEINFEFLSIMDKKLCQTEPIAKPIKKENSSKIVCNKVEVKSEPSSPQNNDENSRATTVKSTADTALAAPCNILRQPFAAANFCGNARAKQVGPSLLKYKEFYDKKRQNTIERMIEEERKNRIFRSKPAPNFALHKFKKPSDFCNVPTMPITPKVLKKSVESEERRKRLLEEYKKRCEPLKFVSRNPQVLYEEPFIPKKTERHVELHPFNLNMEKRLEERKKYDKQFKQIAEEKKRQDEYDKKRCEDQLVREIRKQATFKARPNPFK